MKVPWSAVEKIRLLVPEKNVVPPDTALTPLPSLVKVAVPAAALSKNRVKPLLTVPALLVKVPLPAVEVLLKSVKPLPAPLVLLPTLVKVPMPAVALLLKTVKPP